MVNFKRRKRSKDDKSRVLFQTLDVLDRRGERVSTAEIKKLMQRENISEFLSTARLVEWVTVDRNKDGYLFTIDHELREICAGRRGGESSSERSRPSLPGGFSLVEFLKHLDGEITTRRNANQDYRENRGWNPDPIVKQQQSELLDWIQGELDNLVAMFTKR